MALKEDLDRLMRKRPGRVVAIHEDDAREIVRDAIAPLTARIAELEAENTQLAVERNEALAMRRWNIDRTGDGEVLVCRDHHDKGEDCDHERFVPEERLARAEAAHQQVTAERDEDRAEHARYRASAEEMWETAKRHGGRMLVEKRRADIAEVALATANAELARLRAEGEAKDRRIAELSEALAPFADAAGLFGPPAAGREYTVVDAQHLRAARAATVREGA